jgi:hypothetical protein
LKERIGGAPIEMVEGEREVMEALEKGAAAASHADYPKVGRCKLNR